MPKTAENSGSASLRLTLTVLLLVYLFNFLDRQIIAILAEPIAKDLSLNDTQIGVMTGLAFALFYTFLGLPIARYADNPKSNRVHIIAIAVGLWSFMTVLSGFAQNFTHMLLARMGVGVGEAGGTPPAHSLIADKAPPEKRATAMSIYQLGPAIGGLCGMVIGGLLSDWIGWRYAFIAAGVPGLILAIVVYVFLRDPRFDPAKAEIAAASTQRSAITTIEAFRLLWASKAMRRLLWVAAVGPIAGYGMLIWAAIFFQRSHGLSPGETGLTFGIINGLGMGVGVWFGGFVTDRYAKDKRNVMTAGAISYTISVPFTVMALMVDNVWLSLALFFPAITLLYVHVAPYYSAVQGLVPPQARAIASATILFLQNLLGLGLTPVVLGYASDVLKPEYGDNSVRYVLVLANVFAVMAGVLLWMSRKYMADELDRDYTADPTRDTSR